MPPAFPVRFTLSLPKGDPSPLLRLQRRLQSLIHQSALLLYQQRHLLNPRVPHAVQHYLHVSVLRFCINPQIHTSL